EPVRLGTELVMLARVEAEGVASRSMGAVDLPALARDTTMEVVYAAGQKKIDLGFEGEGGATVSGNRVLLHELIVNLIDNAIRYTPAGGEITVRVTARGGEGVLEVDDNGPGIPVEEREQVFGRFYPGSTAKAEGWGLGLGMGEDMCRSHGARIELGTPGGGKGLRVSVILPSA